MGITQIAETDIFFCQDLVPSVPYKVNIYAMVEDTDSLNESKELHEKVRAPILMAS